RPYTTVATPLTVDGLVIHLRRTLETTERHLANIADPTQRQHYEHQAEQTAQALAVLANGGVPTANPDNWWGLAPLSTDNPIHGLDEQGKPHRVRLSPSTVETAVQSPLQWFIYQISTTGAHLAAATGTFLHAIAEKFPQANVVEMFTEFNTKVPVLAAEAGLTPG